MISCPSQRILNGHHTNLFSVWPYHTNFISPDIPVHICPVSIALPSYPTPPNIYGLIFKKIIINSLTSLSTDNYTKNILKSKIFFNQILQFNFLACSKV